MNLENTNMSQVRYKELTRNFDSELTQQELDDGWHFCLDWDQMLIHRDSREAECCTCQNESKPTHTEAVE